MPGILFCDHHAPNLREIRDLDEEKGARTTIPQRVWRRSIPNSLHDVYQTLTGKNLDLAMTADQTVLKGKTLKLVAKRSSRLPIAR